MPFILITGMFSPAFGDPDGDSVKFTPTTLDPLFKLRRQGSNPSINFTNNSVQLRYEAIDCMEKKAKPPNPLIARDFNLSILGTYAKGPQTPGYILSRSLDKRGRPICFAYPGDAPAQHGSEFYLDAKHVAESANLKIAAAGFAYPMYYDTLFSDLRKVFDSSIVSARKDSLGVWKEDATRLFNWTGDMGTLPPIYPKLWRRIEEYTKDSEYFDVKAPMKNLKQYIDEVDPERVLILSEGHVTGFDNVLDTTDTTVSLRVDPTDMVFQP